MAQKSQKNLEFSVLLDYYGPMLTQKQRDILTEYYNEDLSLAEIAENYGITRQGVRDAIKHGEASLTEMEDKLGVAKHTTARLARLEKLQQLVMEMRCANSGLYTPSRKAEKDGAEAVKIIKQIIEEEEAPDGI